MDINCTHTCHYQFDGKCTLNELPIQTQSINASPDIDCPYHVVQYAR